MTNEVLCGGHCAVDGILHTYLLSLDDITLSHRYCTHTNAHQIQTSGQHVKKFSQPMSNQNERTGLRDKGLKGKVNVPNVMLALSLKQAVSSSSLILFALAKVKVIPAIVCHGKKHG